MNEKSISIHDKLTRLQKDVKLFEDKINNRDYTQLPYNGLNGNKIKVVLSGSYSVGKTTLIRRIFDYYAGSISSAPETAVLIIHSINEVESLTIRFKDGDISLGDKVQKYIQFLDKHKLEKYYNKTSNGVKFPKTEITFDRSSEDILDFLGDSNSYLDIFEFIRWNHKLQDSKQYNILNFVDIYDLPGFNGKEIHEEVLGKIVNSVKPDVLIFILETSQGLQGNEKDVFEKSSTFFSSGLLRFWAFQKGLGEEIDVDKKLKEIKDVTKDQWKINYLDEYSLLDLSGDEDDTEKPQNVIMQEVLLPYFKKSTREYVAKQEKIYRDSSTNYGDIFNNNPKNIIKSIIDSLYRKGMDHTMTEVDARKAFWNYFKIDQDGADHKDVKSDSHNCDDTKATLDFIHNDIRMQVNDIVEYLLEDTLNPFKDKVLDLNKFQSVITKYNISRGWQRLVYMVRMYHTLLQHSPVQEGLGTEILQCIKTDLD